MEIHFEDQSRQAESSYGPPRKQFNRFARPPRQHQERPRDWYSNKTIHLFLFGKYLASPDTDLWKDCFHSLWFILTKRFNAEKNVFIYYVQSERHMFIQDQFIMQYPDDFQYCSLHFTPEEEEKLPLFTEGDNEIFSDLSDKKNDPNNLVMIVSFVQKEPGEIDQHSLSATQEMHSRCKGNIFFRSHNSSQNFFFKEDFDPIAFPPFYRHKELSMNQPFPRKRDHHLISSQNDRITPQDHSRTPETALLEKLTDEELISLGRGDLIAKRRKHPISTSEVIYTPDGKILEIITRTRFILD